MKLIFPLNSHHPPKPISINAIANLPSDLIIEILARLPVKTLCKFRCVSKQWLHLLSLDKSFITRHFEQSKKTPLLLSRKYSKEEEAAEVYKVNIELTSMAMEGNVSNILKASISGPIYTFLSCGPLVLLCCTDCAYVCNPACQDFVPLPRSSSIFTSFNVGFGYVCNSNEYKVVHLFNLDPFNSDGTMGCEVFTLRDGNGDGVINSGGWKRVQDCTYKVHTNCSAICVNGFLYWKITEQGTESSIESILSFDLEREEFRVINYPKCYIDSDQRVLFLTGFRGSLCLVDCSCSTTGKSTMEMWLLKGNGQNNSSSWVKEYIINLSGLDANIEIKGLVPSIEEDGEILMNTEQKGLVYYNPESKVFRRVKNSGMVEWYKKPCLYYDGFFSLDSK